MPTCKQCSTEFKFVAGNFGIFCSRACYAAYRRSDQSEYPKTQYVTLTCESCGKQFDRKAAEHASNQKMGKKHIFCSLRCTGKANKGKKKTNKKQPAYRGTCEQCGNEFKAEDSKPHRFCSIDCVRQYRSTHGRGQNNPNYKGSEYQTKTRKTAYQYYPPRCILCGFDIVVEVHHIVSRYKGGSNEYDNLAVLCPNHHAMAERGLISEGELRIAASDALIQ